MPAVLSLDFKKMQNHQYYQDHLMRFFIIKWKLCYPDPPHYFYLYILIIVKHCCFDKNAIDLINNVMSPFMALKSKH